MAVAGSLDYIINTIWKGGTGVGQAKTGIDALGKSSKDAALQQQILRQETREYGRAVSKMAADVRAGKLSVEDAEKKLAALRQEMGIGEQQTKRSGLRFTELKSKIDLASQALQGAGQIVSTFYGDLKEGAAIVATREKFDALSNSIGASSDAMLGQLKEATNGMVSDAELVANATELMNLKLTKSQEETVRLSAVSGQLGWDMQVLGLTIANQSVARLDSLGLAIEDVKPRAEELRAAGLAANEAFKWAIIEAGEAKMEILGNAAETTAGKIQRLEVAQQNLNDKYKEFVAIRWEPIISGLVGAMDAGAEATDRGHTAWRNYLVVLNELPIIGLMVTDSQIKLAEASGLAESKMEGLTTKAEKLAAVMEPARSGLEMTSAEMGAWSARIAQANPELERNLEISRQFADTYQENAEQAAFMAAVERDIANERGDYIVTTEMITAAEAERNEQARILEQTLAAEAEAQRLMNEETAKFFLQLASDTELAGQYADILGQVEEGSGEAASSTELLNQKLFDQIAAHSENAAATALAGAALGVYTEAEADAMLKSALLEEQIRKQAAAWDGTAAGLQNIQGELASYIDVLNNMPSLIETEVRTNYTSSGTPQTAGPGPGGIPFSQGGVVRGGIPGRDSVPALLMPGERVLTPAQNRAYEQGRGGGGGGLSVTVHNHGVEGHNVGHNTSQAVLDAARRLGIGPA